MRHRKSTKPLLMALIGFAVVNATPGFPHDIRGSTADCGVAPGRGDRERSFAEELHECDGVLEPPKVGDTELVMPAPNIGKTRMIRPGELPTQQIGPDARELPPPRGAPSQSSAAGNS